MKWRIHEEDYFEGRPIRTHKEDEDREESKKNRDHEEACQVADSEVHEAGFEVASLEEWRLT